MKRCMVCKERKAVGTGLCSPCGKSLERVGATHIDLIEWAARRALYFERKRTKPVLVEAARALAEANLQLLKR